MYQQNINQKGAKVNSAVDYHYRKYVKVEPSTENYAHVRRKLDTISSFTLLINFRKVIRPIRDPQPKNTTTTFQSVSVENSEI